MYEPKIVGYLCTWCSYTGADTAGIARLKYPSNLRAVRVPCSGRVSPEIIMRTFDQGADGVLVLGCHIGECHYDSGNHRTAKRIPALHALMEFVGLEPQRLRLDWVSASEGERFARIVNEFTQAVRELGPIRWRVEADQPSRGIDQVRPIWEQVYKEADQWVSRDTDDSRLADHYSQITSSIQAKARELLTNKQVGCVIGYEVSPRGRTRPVFVYDPEGTDRLVWNQECTHNLVTYVGGKLHPVKQGKEKRAASPVGVVLKPCDSRAVNVLLAENHFSREQVYVIGVACEGIYEERVGFARPGEAISPRLQSRCQICGERTPIVFDTLIGGPPAIEQVASLPYIDRLEGLSTNQRIEFWLSQFDRCIRCYACRQACPMCYCPTCLYERDDSLWVGIGSGVNEKRAFHLGRAYHLAGRCIGCNECERVCPMEIPISFLNQKLAKEVETAFSYRAGMAPVPSPFVTILGGEEE